MKSPPSWPLLILVTSPKPHLQVPTYWALELQCINLGTHKHLVQNKKEAGKYLHFSPLWLNTFSELKKVLLFSGRTFHVLLLIITISLFAWHSRLTIFGYMPKNSSISATCRSLVILLPFFFSLQGVFYALVIDNLRTRNRRKLNNTY